MFITFIIAFLLFVFFGAALFFVYSKGGRCACGKPVARRKKQTGDNEKRG